jgi:hypothetical protein
VNTSCTTHRGELTEQLMLGKPLTTRLSRHIAGCARCTRELGEISEVVATLRRAESTFRPARREGGSRESRGAG